MTDEVNSDQFADVSGSKKGAMKGFGGGAQAHTPVEWANTINSTNTKVRLVEVISEGEIQGFVTTDPLQSIYFDETPVKSSDGTLNYQGVSVDLRTGTPDQAHLLLPTAETTIAHNLGRVKAGAAPLVQTITDANATSVRVQILVPALYSVTSQGDTIAWTVAWKIEVKPSNGSWTTATTRTLANQKFTSPQTFQDEVLLPTGATSWQIRVTRITGDSTGATFVGDTYWNTSVIVVAAKLTYPNTAAVGLEVSSASFAQSSVPARSYRIRGKKILVPVNYNPTTRVYTGTWNGNFTRAYSNNPAWILYDLLLNDRYGLGEFLDDSKIDKWGLYTIAQYCDQMVPDGYGGTEPRYTLNIQIMNKQEAFKLIQTIAAVFRGMAFWSMSQVFATADMPSDPIKLYSNANVINGEFNYAGAAIKARHTVALVTWYDPDDFYRPAVEVVIDDAMLRKYGWRELNLEARGCTTRSMANRYGRWALDTEKNSAETVEFVASWDSADIRPGQIISVADKSKAQVRAGGRLVAVSGATLTLDAPFAPAAGKTYLILVETVTASKTRAVATKAINSFSGATVTLASAFSPQPDVGAMWTITGTDIAPRQFRVMSVEEKEPHLFHISGLFHDPTKYARIEQGINFDPPAYSRPPNNIKPPTNLTFRESTYQHDNRPRNRLLVSWTPADDFLAVRYQLSAQAPSGFINYGQVQQTSFTIDNPELGDWELHVAAVAVNGQVSTPLIGATKVKGWSGGPAPYVTHVEIFNKGNDNDFTGKDCRIVWKNNFPGTAYDYGNEPNGAGSGSKNPFYQDNVIRVYDIDTNTLLRLDTVTEESYTYTYEHNAQDYAVYNKQPQRKFRIEVQVRDTLGHESEPVKIICENKVPDLIIPNLSTSVSAIFVDYVRPDDMDFAGAIVWASQTASFNPLTTTPVYDGPLNSISFSAESFKTYYVRIAGYDAFNKFNLNISPPIEVLVAGVYVDRRPPPVPTGLTSSSVTTAIDTLIGGGLDVSIVADWDDCGQMEKLPSDPEGFVNNFAYFEVEMSEGAGSANYFSYQTALSRYTWRRLTANTDYNIRIRAVSQNGYKSAYCTVVTKRSAVKTTPPAKPTALAAQMAITTAFLSWINPADDDLATIQVWRGTKNIAPGATGADAALISSALSQAYTDSNLQRYVNPAATPLVKITYYYWIRAANSSGVYCDFVGPVTAQSNEISAADLGGGSIVADKIAPNAVTGTAVKDGELTNAKLSNLTIEANKIAANAIVAEKIQANAIIGEKIAANAISANKISAGAVTASKLSIAARGLTIEGLVFNFTADSKLYWTSGTIYYIEYDATSGTEKTLSVAVDALPVASAIQWSVGKNIYVAWKRGATALVTSNSPLDYIGADYVSMATYRGGSNLIAMYGRSVIDGGEIATGFLSADRLAAGVIVADKISANAVIAEKIAANAITATKIQANSITGDKLVINTSLPATITIGATGVTIGDPASLINLPSNTTVIQPGKILIGGAKTLDSWRNSQNVTEINGGVIGTNTIRANSLTIGSRNLIIKDLVITANPATNTIQWTSGTILYPEANTSGAIDTKRVTIAASPATPDAAQIWSSGNVIYLNWTKGATTLTPVSAASTAPNPSTGVDIVLLAAYYGGSTLFVGLANTQIDGGQLVSGSIRAGQIDVGAITAEKLSANAVTAVKIAAGQVTADKLGAGTINVTGSIFLGGATFALSSAGQNITIKDAQTTARNRVILGKLGAAVSDYGIQIFNSSGTLIFSSGTGITKDGIAANTIEAGMINATSLSSIRADMGTITAGKIQSSDSKFLIDCTNKTITISD